MTIARLNELSIFFCTLVDKSINALLTTGMKIEGEICGVNTAQHILVIRDSGGGLAMIPFEHVVCVAPRG